jgi:MFS family permease
MSIGNTVAFFGMRVIQFYADKYMEIVLDVEKEVKFVYFIVLCITGPILGILIVGFIMQKIGGYGSRNGMIFIIVLNVVAAIVSMIFPATLNTFISLASAWVYLFCLAAVSPLQGGVIIASLPKELKGNGYAINMFFLNGIGSFPSSYVFALICDFIRDNYDESNMRYKTTMRIVMLYNFFGLLLIILAGIVRFRIKGDLGVEKMGEGKEEEEKADKTDENKEEKNTDNTDENKEEDKEILIGKQE